MASDNKAFLLCGWNGVPTQLDSSPWWQSDPLAAALRRLLLAAGYRELTQEGLEEEPDLVLVVPRAVDAELEVRDLAVFRQGQRRKVLLVHRWARGPGQRNEEEWLRTVGAADFDWENIAAWLQSPPDDAEKEPFGIGVTAAEVVSLLIHPAKTQVLETFETELWNTGSAPILSKSGLRLLSKFDRGREWCQFWYGVLRMSSRAVRFEHDINREAAIALNVDTERAGLIAQKKAIVGRCVDLRASLPCAAELAEDNGPKGILLIDDNPRPIAKELELLRQALLPSFTVWVWNPAESADADSLQRSALADYTSLAADSSSLSLWDRKLRVKKIGDYQDLTSKPENVFLKDIIKQVRFVLVDILFTNELGNDEEDGYRIIRGLRRLLRDPPSTPSDNGEVGDQSPAYLDVLAISRADDVEKIQACLRAGAVGYVLKSRLLALPAVLARITRPIANRTSIHRNLRALYALPNETVGLLRTVRIPFDTCFRDGSSPEDEDSVDSRWWKIADLLRRIPKTDLHVHVGSCMSPEFLVAASMIMLLRHPWDSKKGTAIREIVPLLVRFLSGDTRVDFTFDDLWVNQKDKEWTARSAVGSTTENGDGGETAIDTGPNAGAGMAHATQPIEDWKQRSALGRFTTEVASYLEGQCLFDYQAADGNQRNARSEVSWRENQFRSVVHRALGILDYWDRDRAAKEISRKPPVILLQFALTHGCLVENGKRIPLSDLDKDDVLRVYLLFLAARGDRSCLVLGDGNSGDGGELNCLEWFTGAGTGVPQKETWEKMQKDFYESDGTPIAPEQRKGVQVSDGAPTALEQQKAVQVLVRLAETDNSTSPLGINLRHLPYDSIRSTLASGTRAENLREYLYGCEFSGAEHLQHPYLIWLYAQQVVMDFVRQGVLYAELRAAVTGYVTKGFELRDVLQTLLRAFASAQTEVCEVLCEKQGQQQRNSTWLWHSTTRFSFDELSDRRGDREGARPEFPTKIGLIFTGKRHKPSWHMIREAAAAVVLRSLPPDNLSAQEFTRDHLRDCRPVGFDLAGEEVDSNPEQFRIEFERLSKLHIPITVHAGENASSRYVESAIIDLRARRLGHGLTLVDDPQLTDRAREERVCVELCPVSNYQTNRFRDERKGGAGRKYPLRTLLDNGNAVCINTDNPIISHTNIIKEYFQASYAFGEPGLSLWEALRIIRMGFVHSFMSLPERRAMLELVDQIIFDLFSSQAVVDTLRSFVRPTGRR